MARHGIDGRAPARKIAGHSINEYNHAVKLGIHIILTVGLVKLFPGKNGKPSISK